MSRSSSQRRADSWVQDQVYTHDLKNPNAPKLAPGAADLPSPEGSLLDLDHHEDFSLDLSPEAALERAQQIMKGASQNGNTAADPDLQDLDAVKVPTPYISRPDDLASKPSPVVAPSQLLKFPRNFQDPVTRESLLYKIL